MVLLSKIWMGLRSIQDIFKKDIIKLEDVDEININYEN